MGCLIGIIMQLCKNGGVFVKNNVYVEFYGEQYDTKVLVEKAKEIWKELGYKVKDIETLNIYIKPEEHICYYLINESIEGKFEI